MQHQAHQSGLFPLSIDGLSLPEGNVPTFPDGTDTSLWISASGMTIAEAGVLLWWD